MPEVHVYLSRRDKAFVESLPPDVTVAQILREALELRRGCAHDVTMLRCVRCGAELEAPAELDVAGVDVGQADDVEAPRDVDTASASDGDPVAIG